MVSWAVAEETPQGLLLKVRNGSGRRLRGAWLVVDGSAYPLGAIVENADLELTLGDDVQAQTLESPVNGELEFTLGSYQPNVDDAFASI